MLARMLYSNVDYIKFTGNSDDRQTVDNETVEYDEDSCATDTELISDKTHDE